MQWQLTPKQTTTHAIFKVEPVVENEGSRGDETQVTHKIKPSQSRFQEVSH